MQYIRYLYSRFSSFYQQNHWFRIFLRSCLGLGVVAILVVVVFYYAVAWGSFGKIPDRESIQSYQNDTASEVYSVDSVLIGKYFLQERTNVAFEDLPNHLIEALIATEDVRFYQHQGVDYRSLFRVAIKSLLLQDQSSGGGSTITQQLAKNIFPREGTGSFNLAINKVKEMIVARRIEEVYTKSEILALYFNTVSFGYNAFGIETASKRFFNKPPNLLTIQESAVLVGMLKATTLYNPYRNPKRAETRRNLVFHQMMKYQFLNTANFDSLKTLPMEINFTSTTHNEGTATYFREYLRAEIQKWAKEQTTEEGDPVNLYTDGLKIYTTIHSKMQQYAEESVEQHMTELQQVFYKHWGKTRPWHKNPRTLLNAIRKTPRYQNLKSQGMQESEIQEIFKKPYTMKVFTWEGEKEMELSPLDSIRHYLYFLNAGFMAMDPQNGAVRAWVGGINHKYFKYDHVNVNTKRQVGSVFKPIVYAAALESGVKPCDFVSSKRITYTNFDDWSPGNADDNYQGYYSVKGALAQSVNTVSVKVLKRTSISRAIEMARIMGISNEIPEVPSIALGTPNISLFEMVGAFGSFANQGNSVKPRYLSKIVNQQGNVLADFEVKVTSQKAMSANTATMMLHMMKNVVDKGTAQRLRSVYKLKNDIAGKTGTTQSHADGWFIGVTPKLVAGAWVGSDDPNIHFRTITYGQGAAMALPIWALFMQRVNADKEFDVIRKSKFPSPSSTQQQAMDCVDYKESRDFHYLFQQILGNRKKRPLKRKQRKRNRRY